MSAPAPMLSAVRLVRDSRAIGRQVRQLRLERGWSQSELIDRVRAAMCAQGLRPPPVSSLRVMVSRWENGHEGVGEFYAEILTRVLDPQQADSEPGRDRCRATRRAVPGEVDRRFGEALARYRRRRGLTQTVVAGLIGRSAVWLSGVERGTVVADRLSDLADLARVLRVDVADLLAAKGVPL
jgi:transcriptional regulator with XRE-family HTH domain